jgi:peptide deformylase
MAVRPILLYPDPILKQICSPADWGSEQTQQLCQDLCDTVAASPGVGLAAPQIGVALRAIVVDVTPKHPGHGLLLLLNPRLLSSQGSVNGREGCLSIPEYTANVTRKGSIRVAATDRHGQPIDIHCEGFEAICLQHELDHLEGILFLDRVSSLKTDVFRRKGVARRPELEAMLARLQP